jgi:amino acid transporter
MSDVSETPQQELFVRRSTGLVREASAVDAAIFNAVFSAPVGATLAWGVFFALAAFPGSDLVTATILAFILNVPVLIMMSLLAASMPRTGGDYVWVSRILSPPLAVVSNFGAAFSALIGATFWARYFPVFGLGPILSTLGVIFDKPDLVRWGNNFQTHKWWIFFGALAMIVLMTAILMAGTRMVFRWQNTFWAIASVGTFLAFVVFLFGSSSSLQDHFNALAHKFGGQGDVFHKIVAAAPATSGHPGTWDATAPAIFVIMTFMMWNWWSAYLAGELKSAANRNRQLGIMFGALAWDVVFLVIGVLLIYKVAGYAFMAGVNAGTPDYTIPTGPWYHFIASLVYNNDVLTILIVGSFAFWSLPAMVGNTFMPVRTVFAWAFDRLLPERFADVDERRHAPVPAILLVMGIVTLMLLWSVEKTTFQTWLALGVLAGVVCVWIVSIAAFTFPDRRPDLYEASPANINVGGVPVLKIVAPLSFLVMAFLVYDTLKYPALALSGDSSHRWYVPAFMLGTAAFGLVVYYAAKYVRRGAGVDVDLVYRELPPD